MDETEREEQECTSMVVSRSGMGHVAVCAGCGNVHLTMEYLTVRLQPGAFLELVGMVGDAHRKIAATSFFRHEAAADAAADEPVH